MAKKYSMREFYQILFDKNIPVDQLPTIAPKSIVYVPDLNSEGKVLQITKRGDRYMYLIGTMRMGEYWRYENQIEFRKMSRW